MNMLSRLVLAASVLALSLAAQAASKRIAYKRPVMRPAQAAQQWPGNSYEADPRYNPRCYFSTEQATWMCN